MIVSEAAKSSMPRNKSMEDLKSTDYTDLNQSLNDSRSADTKKESSLSLNSVSRGPSPAQQMQHSMLEKCLRLYESFYVKLIERRVLDREKSIPELFDNLIVSSCKESFEERTRTLERLLKSKLDLEDSGFFSQELCSPEEMQLGMRIS